MKARLVVLAVCIAVITFGVVGIVWMAGGFVGRPVLAVSNENGTSRIFRVSEESLKLAITNAFDLFKYPGVLFTSPIGEDWMAPNWHPTNGYLLQNTGDPLAKVPMEGLFGRRNLRYRADFHVTIVRQTNNETVVNVRTVYARVLDGISLTHSGFGPGFIQVPPIRREEENVLSAIQKELEGGTNR
jgi:hypothetical protein